MASSIRASNSQATDASAALPSTRHVSEWRRFMRRASRSPQGIAGFVIVVLFALMALFGPLISPYSPTRQQMSKRLADPGAEFLLGTDDFGRDVLSRILYGAEPSFRVGIFSVGLALLAGLALGIIAGYRGGRVDGALMLAMDVLFAFPAVLLAIAIMALLGPKLENVILAIGVVNLPVFVRLTRASVLSVKGLPYIESARAVGVPSLRIAVRHILPNILAPLVVQTSLTIAAAILTEASLSYLGLGNPPPAPSWGNILASTYGFIETRPWPTIFSGLAIMLAVLGFNLMGDGLRDVLDPTTRD